MSMSSSSLQLYDTYLPHLEIGDHPTKHDVLESDPRKINLLQVHDFAWIKRSNDRWTYAIIAEREDGKICRDQGLIRFVVDGGGSTKVFSRKHWATSIRLVNPPRKPVEELTREMQKETQQQRKPSGDKSRSRSRSKSRSKLTSFLSKPRLPPMNIYKVSPPINQEEQRRNIYKVSPPITQEEQRRMATSYSTLIRTESMHGSSRGIEPWMDRSDPSLGVGVY